MESSSFHIETTKEYVFTIPGCGKTFSTRDEDLAKWILSLMERAAMVKPEEQ